MIKLFAWGAIAVAMIIPLAYQFHMGEIADSKLTEFNSKNPTFFTTEHVSYALDTELRLYDLSTGREIKDYVVKFPMGEIWEGRAGEGRLLSGSIVSNCKNNPIVPAISLALLLIGIAAWMKGHEQEQVAARRGSRDKEPPSSRDKEPPSS